MSGWPSLPERMCKRKATPPSGLGSVLLDMPKDRHRGPPEGGQFFWSPSIGNESLSGSKISRHIFLEVGGNQGPVVVQDLRVDWVVGASIKEEWAESHQIHVGIQCPAVTGVQNPDFLCLKPPLDSRTAGDMAADAFCMSP